LPKAIYNPSFIIQSHRVEKNEKGDKNMGTNILETQGLSVTQYAGKTGVEYQITVDQYDFREIGKYRYAQFIQITAAQFKILQKFMRKRKP
jgi:hypothetical protein